MSVKPRSSSRDRLAANLVLIAIFGMIFLGVCVLYLTGIFNPAEGGEAILDGTPPLALVTQPPKQEGLASRLFPAACAEDAPLEPDVAPDTKTPADPGAGMGLDLDALLEGILKEEMEEEVISEKDVIAFNESDLCVNRNLPGDWTHVLLLGVDSRNFATKTGNTDLMMIASVNEKTGEIKLASLARDMYVQIPDSTFASRVNTAYAYGGCGKTGAKLALKTVNMTFELNIQYYVVVNFADVVEIVDAIGGVDIHLAEAEFRYINEYVAIGEDHEGFPKSSARRTLTEQHQNATVHLDGLQSLSYARIRKLDNDLQRGSRQRIMINAVLEKVMATLSPASIMSLANVMTPHTETNFPIPTEGMRIGVALLWADSISFRELSVPVEGSYHYMSVKGRNGANMEVVSFSQQANTKALHEFIYGEYIPAEAAQ